VSSELEAKKGNHNVSMVAKQNGNTSITPELPEDKGVEQLLLLKHLVGFLTLTQELISHKMTKLGYIKLEHRNTLV